MTFDLSLPPVHRKIIPWFLTFTLRGSLSKQMAKEASTYEKSIRETLGKDPKKAFEMIVDYLQEPLYWHIRRIVVSHEDASDALQETFVKMYRSIGKFRWDSSLRVWAYRIATNESLDAIKSRKPSDLLDPESMDSESSYIDYGNEMQINFQKAIQGLPEKQRVVFLLRYYEEMDYDQIGQLAGMSADTAKVNYCIAKKKVRQYMTDNFTQ